MPFCEPIRSVQRLGGRRRFCDDLVFLATVGGDPPPPLFRLLIRPSTIPPLVAARALARGPVYLGDLDAEIRRAPVPSWVPFSWFAVGNAGDSSQRSSPLRSPWLRALLNWRGGPGRRNHCLPGVNQGTGFFSVSPCEVVMFCRKDNAPFAPNRSRVARGSSTVRGKEPLGAAAWRTDRRRESAN